MPDKDAMIRVVQYVVAISLFGLVVALMLQDVQLIVMELLVLATLLWMIAKIRGSS